MTTGDETHPPPVQPEARPAVHDGMAISSLILGILWLWGIGAILAVIFGLVSRSHAKNAHRKTSAMAIWGVWLGAVGILGAVIITAVIVIGVASGPSNGFYNMNTLEQSVQNQVNQDSNFSIGATVESCAMTGSNTAQCIISNDGSNVGITVQISNNGNSWVETQGP